MDASVVQGRGGENTSPLNKLGKDKAHDFPQHFLAFWPASTENLRVERYPSVLGSTR